MPDIKVKGYNFHYECYGRSGPPMALIHGWTSYNENWRPVAEAFRDRYRIIMPDLLGHGGSDKPPRGYSIPEQGAYMAELLKRLGFKKDIILGGHSMGGMIALWMALHYPGMFSRLILAGTSATGTYSRLKRLGNDLSMILLRANYPFFYRFSIPLVFSDNATQEMKQRHIQNTIRTPAHVAVEAYLDGIRNFNVAKSLSRVRIPTLILYGEKDRMFSLQEQHFLHKNIKGSRFFMITHAGHEIFMEQPEAVNEAIFKFLNDVD